MQPEPSGSFVPPSRVLVAVAMEVEERALRDRLRFGAQTVAGVPVLTAEREGRTVHLVRTGVGPVRAAVQTAFLCREVRPDAVLLLGVGGALSPALEVGDLVVASGIVQHDCVLYGEAGDELMAPGALHLSLAPGERPPALLRCDPHLQAWARSAALAAGIAMHAGLVLSGNSFIASKARKRALRALHEGALLVDMEAGGIGQVLRDDGIPFVAAKTVADRLGDGGAIEAEYRDFLPRAAANAGAVLDALLAIPPGG